MDEILTRASNQAMSFAIRSGVSIASGYAIKTVSKLLERIPEGNRARIQSLRSRLEVTVTILSSSIDLIKLRTSQGNSSLEPTLKLIDGLTSEIDDVQLKLDNISRNLAGASDTKSTQVIETIILRLLDSVNNAIPLLNLAISTSGLSATNARRSNISLSQLLQAHGELNAQFSNTSPSSNSKIGPAFELNVFTVFLNPSRQAYVEVPTPSSDDSPILWKEEFARAICQIHVKLGKLYDYELVINESFKDGRYHEDDDIPRKMSIDLMNIVRQFASAAGQLLRVEGVNSRVLTLKIEEKTKVTYLALGELSQDFESESDASLDASSYEDAQEEEITRVSSKVSLLEYLIKLCKLQTNEQQRVSEIDDEKLWLYLRNDNTPGEQSSESKPSSTSSRAKKQSSAIDHTSNIDRLTNLNLNSSDSNGNQK